MDWRKIETFLLNRFRGEGAEIELFAGHHVLAIKRTRVAIPFEVDLTRIAQDIAHEFGAGT